MAKNQSGTIPREVHAERKKQSKARKRNKKRGQEEKESFILREGGVPPRAKRNHPHTSQYYLERDDLRTAHDLCRSLRGRHKRAVLGFVEPPLPKGL